MSVPGGWHDCAHPLLTGMGVVSRGNNGMSTVDAIAQARERLTERLMRLDAERSKLAQELADLEAAERVIARFTKAKRARRAPNAAGLSLGEATLRAVVAHDGGTSAMEVRKYLAEQLGIEVRANHLGMALQRHRRAGRLEQRELLWYPRQPLDTERPVGTAH